MGQAGFMSKCTRMLCSLLLVSPVPVVNAGAYFGYLQSSEAVNLGWYKSEGDHRQIAPEALLV
jgi:hypothetical protein